MEESCFFFAKVSMIVTSYLDIIFTLWFVEIDRPAKVCFTHFKSCDHNLGSFNIILLFALVAQLCMARNILEKSKDVLSRH